MVAGEVLLSTVLMVYFLAFMVAKKVLCVVLITRGNRTTIKVLEGSTFSIR